MLSTGPSTQKILPSTWRGQRQMAAGILNELWSIWKGPQLFLPPKLKDDQPQSLTGGFLWREFFIWCGMLKAASIMASWYRVNSMRITQYLRRSWCHQSKWRQVAGQVFSTCLSYFYLKLANKPKLLKWTEVNALSCPLAFYPLRICQI